MHYDFWQIFGGSMRYLLMSVVGSFLFFSSIQADEEKPHEITIAIKIVCPKSDELNAFANSIPREDDYFAPSFEDWKQSFISNMTQLIQLVESEKVYNSFWSVNIDEGFWQPQEE